MEEPSEILWLMPRPNRISPNKSMLGEGINILLKFLKIIAL